LPILAIAVCGLVVVAAGIAWRFRTERSVAQAEVAVVRRGDFVRTLRINGTTEAVQFITIVAPRFSGSGGSLVITKLVDNGAAVRKGDLLVEFDPQAQQREALDREADYKDLLQQIVKKKADQAAQLASDRTELVAAEHALATARLNLRKNEVISAIDAEKNREAADEAKATLEQLQQTFQLKRQAAQAELRTLEIQRDRGLNAMRHAQQNSRKVTVRAPLAGIAVLNTNWRNGQITEWHEGDQVNPGAALIKLVNPELMQVRSRVNQTDVGSLTAGQPVRVTLDAYPDLTFEGRVGQIAMVGQASGLNDKVRFFQVFLSIKGSDPRLMPDLSAAVDVEVQRKPGILLVPRDALVQGSGEWFVYRKTGASYQKSAVKIDEISDMEAVIQSGAPEGAQLLRNPLGSGGQL
jgi:multidrug efflux pump subunit AcrA (membrane-fusion protein)